MNQERTSTKSRLRPGRILGNLLTFAPFLDMNLFLKVRKSFPADFSHFTFLSVVRNTASKKRSRKGLSGLIQRKGRLALTYNMMSLTKNIILSERKKS